MKDKILAKMESHVKSILDKPIITDNEYMLIAGYLNKIEYDEKQAETKKMNEESQERLKNAMSLIGGAF